MRPSFSRVTSWKSLFLRGAQAGLPPAPHPCRHRCPPDRLLHGGWRWKGRAESSLLLRVPIFRMGTPSLLRMATRRGEVRQPQALHLWKEALCRDRPCHHGLWGLSTTVMGRQSPGELWPERRVQVLPGALGLRQTQPAVLQAHLSEETQGQGCPNWAALFPSSSPSH